MSAVAEALVISRQHLSAMHNRPPPRQRGQAPLPDAELVGNIQALTADLPTHGYCRVHALPRRHDARSGRAAPNPKRVYQGRPELQASRRVRRQGAPSDHGAQQGQLSDYKDAALMLDTLAKGQNSARRPRCDADWFRAVLPHRKIAACIPSRANRRDPIPHDTVLYRGATRSRSCLAA